jgi:hypothetical protein
LAHAWLALRVAVILSIDILKKVKLPLDIPFL